MANKFEKNNPTESRKGNEAIKTVFERLSRKIAGKDILFKDEQDKERFLVMLNPAGNLSIHDYETGNDCLVWDDGKIEALSTSDPEKIVDSPSVERLTEIADEVESLRGEELEKPQ